MASGDAKNEVWGSGSRCFTGNFLASMNSSPTSSGSCHQFECNEAGDTLTIKLTNLDVTCDAADSGTDKTLMGNYAGYITCPDVERFCLYASWGENDCPDNCNDRGICVDKFCNCP